MWKTLEHCIGKWFTLFTGYPPTSFNPLPTAGSPGKVGDTKFLVCRTSSNPVASNRWLKDGEYVTNSSTSYTFKIENLDLHDVGRYRCEASNPLGAILSPPADLYVAYLNSIEGQDNQYALTSNSTKAVVIPVPEIDSYPQPTITWYLNNQPVNTEGVRHQITLNGSLVLLDRKIGDSANYYKVEVLNGIANSLQEGPSYYLTIAAHSGAESRLPPSLVIGPKDAVAFEDQDTKVDFECIINASPVQDVQMFWYKVLNGSKDQILGSDKYLIPSIGQRTLTITSPTQSDIGTYQCEATLDGFDTRVIASAQLTVYASPALTNQIPGEINRDFGQTVTINCTASGVPIPTVHWYYNAREIGKDFNSSSHMLHSNGSLTVSQLDLEHAGMYQCFLRNIAGETSKATYLKVNSSPPVMINPPKDISLLEGETARFTCETRGAPKPVVTWKRVLTSGITEEITDSGRIQILDRGELLIVSAQPEDSGIYTCNASNSQGHISDSATLQVLVRTQINKPPQDQRIIKGSTATIFCGVSHDPNVHVTWQWSHRKVHAEVNEVIIPDSRRTVDAFGTLTINGIKNMDIGNYTCHVMSSAGNDTRSITLTVLELPQPPVVNNVLLHPTNVRAVIVRWTPSYDGNTPILKFSVQYKELLYGSEGDGDDLNWLTSDSDIEPDVREATVTGLRPAKFYQFRVFASNEVGEGLPSDPKPDPPLEMPQQPPSSPPRGFFGMPHTNKSVLLGWQPPDEDSLNGPLLGYEIQYKPAGYPNSTFQRKTVNILTVNPRYELKELEFYQEYEIQIAAYNSKGVGVFSSLINVMTLEGHPTAPPEQLRVIAFNSTAISVSWTPPNQQFINGRNLGYKVLGKRIGDSPTEFVVVVPQDQSNPSGTQTTVLANLKKYTQYNISVLCYTSQGDGPAAPDETVRTLEDLPSQVDSLTFSDIRATSLKVSWTAPTEINGVLQGYTLSYRKKNESTVLQTVDLPATNETYTVFGLSPMTKYTISVYASTAIGAGPSRSADIESGVPPERPTAPYNLGVSNIRARSVLLQFLPGFDGKTSITLWIVEALEGDGNTNDDEYKVIYEVSDPSARSLQVQNLKPYTHYKLRITAENIVGRSDPSEPTRQFQTIQDAPGAPPGNVTVRALNATALRVSWTPLSKNDWNGEPRGYKIFYKNKDHSNAFKVLDLDNGMNMDSAILGNLEEWMQYEVKMIAYNDVGESIYSPITVERTRESVPSSGPLDVQAVAISSTSVNVSWGQVPSMEQNGMIEGFKIEYRSSEQDIDSQSLQVSGNTSSSVIVENLRKFVTYEIRVLAYTRMGDGVPSSPEVTVKTTADVPGPPQKIWFPDVSYSLVTVVWEPPAEPNGIITGYMVAYKLRDSPDNYVNSSSLSPKTLNFTVGNLQRQAYYEFRVTAKTTLGWGETASVEVFTMTNRSSPDSPSKPAIKSSQVQARSVTISWIPAPFNGYGPLRNFTVQYRNGQSWISVKETIPPTVTTYPVRGLSPDTGYVFRVAATNDIGTSPFSVQSDDVRTLEDNPEGAPRHVKVDRLTTTSVKVTWEQPLPHTLNGDLLGYTLMYKQVENSNYMEVQIPETSVEKVLQNLVKFVNYEFLVKAFNSVGDGPTSTPVTVFVGEAAPTAPPLDIRTEAVNSTEILVSWQPPPLESQNGDLSGYRISYWRRSESEDTAKQVTKREKSVVLTDLDIYTEYAISLQAINLAGEGPRSEIFYQKTLQGLPGKPANLEFWNVTYVSLDVHWQPPVKPNGLIVNYTLSYLEVNAVGGSKLVKFDVPGNLTHLKINDLQEGITYLFKVLASTVIGQGEVIEREVQPGPQKGSPGPPDRIIIKMQPSGQKLDISWIDGVPGDYPIFSHMIQAKSIDSEEWLTVLQTTDEPKAELNLLQFSPNTRYQVRVIALNKIGMSQYSKASLEFRTPAIAKADAFTSKDFYYEWWFLVIVALTGLIIILIVISLLCLVGRSSRRKQRTAKEAPVSSTSNLAPSIEPDEGGFSNFEMTNGRQSTHSRRSKYAGISRNGAANNIYARSPPRPSPASVAYSDDDGASSVKPPLPDDDDTASTCTEKPSELGDSSEADESSDNDSLDLPPPPPPASPPPPPFSQVTRNPYSDDRVPAVPNKNNLYTSSQGPPHDPPPLPDRGVINNSWQNQNNSSFNAYQYTDSEAESSHYAFSLNGGQIVLNNTAGSRAPLPGFSSFV
ncbi:Protein sidekick-2 [Mactra antiquata]